MKKSIRFSMQQGNKTTKTATYLQKTLAFIMLLGIIFPLVAQGGAMDEADCLPRPLSDFLNNQGQSGSNFFPPVADYLGWADGPFVNFALVDYAGLANAWLESQGVSLGTQSNGRVLECELADGAAKISVVLNTSRALGFAQLLQDIIDNEFDFLNTPTIFGNKAQDVLTGAEPALGAVSLKTSFIMSAPGEDLPDLYDVINNPDDYAPVTIDFRSTTVGTLPDGTRASLRVQEVGAASEGDNSVSYSRELVDLIRERGMK